MTLSKWYRDRLDNLLSIELDPSFDGFLELDWQGYFASPVTLAQAQAPVAENGGSASVTVISADDEQLRFRASALGPVGSAAKVRFQVTFGGGQSDSLTVRLRSATQ